MLSRHLGPRGPQTPDSAPAYTIGAGPEGMRFLLISGKPLEEPVAWHGPIVMNTQRELQRAMRELNSGTFIKRSAAR